MLIKARLLFGSDSSPIAVTLLQSLDLLADPEGNTLTIRQDSCR